MDTATEEEEDPCYSLCNVVPEEWARQIDSKRNGRLVVYRIFTAARNNRSDPSAEDNDLWRRCYAQRVAIGEVW